MSSKVPGSNPHAELDDDFIWLHVHGEKHEWVYRQKKNVVQIITMCAENRGRAVMGAVGVH